MPLSGPSLNSNPCTPKVERVERFIILANRNHDGESLMPIVRDNEEKFLCSHVALPNSECCSKQRGNNFGQSCTSK